jgi:hypothetical protein
MFYSDTQSFLNFLTILNRLEVGVFDRAVKFHSSCIKISTAGQKHGEGTTRFNTLIKKSGRFDRAGYIQFRPEKSFNYLILKTPYLQNLRFRTDSILGYMHFRPAVPVVLNKIY